MKEHPILFNSDMIRAILDGRKTQTRRVIKPQPEGTARFSGCNEPEPYVTMGSGMAVPWKPGRCPYGVPGDVLWVRETTWRSGGYVATEAAKRKHEGKVPSIFMRRCDSRITLEVTGVRVERVADISSNDALAEGVDLSRELFAGVNAPDKALRLFPRLWDSINAKRDRIEGDQGSWPADYGPYCWDANPWVFVVSFKRTKP